MRIRCEKCGKVTDLKNTAAIMWYLKQGLIKCKRCGEDIELRSEKGEGGDV